MVYADSSTEQLQSRLSSVMAENSSLKENRMDSEAKIRLLQVHTIIYIKALLDLHNQLYMVFLTERSYKTEKRRTCLIR